MMVATSILKKPVPCFFMFSRSARRSCNSATCADHVFQPFSRDSITLLCVRALCADKMMHTFSSPMPTLYRIVANSFRISTRRAYTDPWSNISFTSTTSGARNFSSYLASNALYFFAHFSPAQAVLCGACTPYASPTSICIFDFSSTLAIWSA